MSRNHLLLQYAVESGEINPLVEIPVNEPDRDDDLFELAGESLDQSFEQMNRAINLTESFEALSMHFLSANDVSEESLEGYRVSVGALLAASGLKIPTSLVVPSFEAVDTAGAKKVGVLRRIYEWIKNFIKTLVNSITKFFGISRQVFMKKSKDLKDLKAKLSKIDVNAKPKRKADIMYYSRVPSVDALYSHLSSIQTEVSTVLGKFPTAVKGMKGFQLKKDTTEGELGRFFLKNAGRCEIGKAHLRVDQYGLDYNTAPMSNFQGKEVDAFSPVTMLKIITVLEKIFDTIVSTSPVIEKALEDNIEYLEDKTDGYWKANEASNNLAAQYEKARNMTTHDPELMEQLRAARLEAAQHAEEMKGYKTSFAVHRDIASAYRSLVSEIKLHGYDGEKTLSAMVLCYKVDEKVAGNDAQPSK